MKLAVLSNQSIATLVEWVNELFSDVPNHNVPNFKNSYSNIQLFTEHELEKLYKTVPIRDTRELLLMFPVRHEEDRDLWMVKADRYFAHLLGHEGAGSLFAYLKNLGLLNALSAGSMSQFHNYSIFTITMKMTNEGEKQWEKLVSCVYEYLKLLRTKGPQEWIYRECANIALAQFKFLDKKPSSNFTSSLASSMQKYPIDKVLSGNYLYFKYDPDILSRYIDQLVPSNMNIYFSSKSNETEATEVEQWYGVKYSKNSLKPELIQMWEQGKPFDQPSDIKLPIVNPFIPENFDIKDISEKKPYPELIRDNGKVKAWFKQDYTFNQPKVNIFYNIIIPEAYSSPRVVVLNKLFTLIVGDQLNEIAYEAELAGVSYDIQASVTGFIVLLTGYNDKIKALNDIVFERIVNCTINPQRFEIIKTDLAEQYKNMIKSQPLEHAVVTSYEALYLQKWTYMDYLEAMENISLKMMENFVPQFLSCLQSELLIIGNMRKEEALNFVDVTEDILFGDNAKRICKPTVPLKSQVTEERIVQLELGKDYLIQHLEPNPAAENSAIEIIYQIGLRSIVDDLRLDLLTQILSSAYSSQLRTVEQIGYLVFSRARRDNNINSLSFLMQSSDKSPPYMRVRSDLFIQEFHHVLKKMSEDEVKEHIRGLRATIEEKDKQLKEEAVRYWREIVSHQYTFNLVELKLKALEQLNKDSILSFYEKYLLLTSNDCKRVIVQYFAKKHWSTQISPIPDPSDATTAEEKEILVVREAILLPQVLAEWKSGMFFHPGFIKYASL